MSIQSEEGAMVTNYQDNKISGRRSVPDRRMLADHNYKGLEKRVIGDRRKGTRQRENPRFQAKEGAYAAIQADYNIIGFIKDISKGGLALQYITEGKRLSGLLKIDLFSNSKDSYLTDVPFKTVSDFHVDSTVPFSTTMLRQCCGTFADLTDKQRSQLDHFIEKQKLS